MNPRSFDALLRRPRDAVKAIRRRIVANNNFQEIMLTLTVSRHGSSTHENMWYTLLT